MFYRFGPRIDYSTSSSGFAGSRTTYAELMVADDGNRQTRSYLASEENFAVLKELHLRNMIVPLVGNFGGPKTIRAVGNYLKERNVSVSAFYLSNVEQYLWQDGIWNDFCRNVSTLPLDETSTFIRSLRFGQFGQGVGLNSELGNMLDDTRPCVAVR